MTSTETSCIKKLKHDISQKNEIRGEIERRVNSVCLWKHALDSSKKFQEQKRYAASIKRYVKEIERLRTKLNRMNEALDKRIREAGDYSTSEIDDFKSQVEQKISDIESDKETKKVKKVHRKKIKKVTDEMSVRKSRRTIAVLKREKELQKKIEKANNQIAMDIEEVEKAIGKIIKFDKRLGKISKSGGVETGELATEERDKISLTQELKRIIRERAIYN